MPWRLHRGATCGKWLTRLVPQHHTLMFPRSKTCSIWAYQRPTKLERPRIWDILPCWLVHHIRCHSQNLLKVRSIPWPIRNLGWFTLFRMWIMKVSGCWGILPTRNLTYGKVAMRKRCLPLRTSRMVRFVLECRDSRLKETGTWWWPWRCMWSEAQS